MNKKKIHKERQMTISTGQRHLNGSYNLEPCLRLMGKWLYDAGFSPGDRVQIGVKTGKLEIRKKNNT